MNSEAKARLQLLLHAAKSKGYIDYPELADLFSDDSAIGPELDEVLLQLEQAGLQAMPDSKLIPSESEPVLPHIGEYEQIIEDPVQVYLRLVAELPLLTFERETELAEKIATDAADADTAKTQLMYANLWLVYPIAQQYRVRGLHILDLIEKGNSALMKAAGTFNHARGYRFSTYAIFWVNRSLHDYRPKRVVPAHLQ